jgi:hypothetical protein
MVFLARICNKKKGGGAPELFLVWSTPEEKHTLTLSTTENLRFLEASPIHFHDGTFKTSPRQFPQLFTIHWTVMGHVMPSVLALPARKIEDTVACTPVK